MVIKIEYKPWNEDKKLSKQQIVEFSNQAVSAHGNAFAEDIIQRFRKWFSPDPGLKGVVPIYETGRTMNAFKPEGGKGRGGIVNVQVVEGGNAQHVREGLPPGTSVSLGRLKAWAARKNIRLLSYAEYRQKLKGGDAPDGGWSYGGARIIQSFESRSSKGKPFTTKEHGRSERNQKDIVNSALRAIQTAIKEEGTERPGAIWDKYYPGGSGYFDYPTYLVVQRKGLINKLAQDHADDLAQAMVSFWNSAGTQKVFDPTKMGKRGGFEGAIRRPNRYGAID